MAQVKTYEELQLHIDQLWKIIEQRDTAIQDLKMANQKLTKERNELAEKLRQLPDQDIHDNHSPPAHPLASIATQSNPTLPTRSPYRPLNASEVDLHAKQPLHISTDIPPPLPPTTSGLDPSHPKPATPHSIATTPSPASHSPQPGPQSASKLMQLPLSPKIIENDAKLFAQYQSAVLKRDRNLDTRRVQHQTPPQPMPSKSSTLPTQREAKVQDRKTHTSMVFSPTTVIPVDSPIQQDPHPLDTSTPPPNKTPFGTSTWASINYHTQQLNNMEGVSVKVIGSMLRSNVKGKDVVSFVISVGKQGPALQHDELWRVEKLYSDFLDLDLQVKAQMGRIPKDKSTRLPEKQLFATRSPNKLDQRKVALEKYLLHIITLPIADIGCICQFLSTDVMDPSSYEQERKEGYLTKRGKNFGGWKTRYFVLKRNRLEYFEMLGTILLEGAQIGRQNPSTAGTVDNEHAYRHAFLILENRKHSLGGNVRHILCASSDIERDVWINALLQTLHGQMETASTGSQASTAGIANVNSPTPTAHSNNNNTPNSIPNGKSMALRRSNSAREPSRRQTTFSQDRKKSSASDKRKLSKDDIRTVSATPISCLKPENGQQINLEKLSSVPSLPQHQYHPPQVDPIDTNSLQHMSLPLPDQQPAQSLPHQSSPPLLDHDQSPSVTSPISNNDSPVTPRPQYQPALQLNFDRQSLVLSEKDDLPPPSTSTPTPTPTPTSSPAPAPTPSVTSGMLRPESPGPQPGRRGSDENDRKKKNRMTLWGKKVFGTQQRSATEPPINGSNASLPENGQQHDPSSITSPSTSPTPTDASHGNTKSIRQILTRPSAQPNDKPSHRSPKQIFGIPLQEAVRVSRIAEGYELPAVVYRCIEYLDARNAFLEEGLYRLSGSNAVLQALKKKFNQEGDVDLLMAKTEYDVHVIAGLLKLWLRELPVSVLTRELRPEFVEVIDLLERKDRVNELGRLVSLLPLANYTLLRVLTAHLIKVVKHSQVNLMPVRNISIVFSPTLGIPGSIFNLFLSEFDYIFWTNNKGEAAPRRVDDESLEDDQPSSRTESPAKQDPSSNEPKAMVIDPTDKSSMVNMIKPQVPIPRGRLHFPTNSTLLDSSGRSNRNSVFYMDSAPSTIVNIEKQADGNVHLLHLITF
ncbi:RhoGAP-domain-containing protein [Hesseltinella vesiculosa]|uniref:RhoGAP-domain-containing protein n=1 Tax=Hesseltinella vesiculosa TaxID=101127 RepID=A0A1X2GDL2_9FUNG|nr:RhoGAP-domain-containing protein [Hesseltinella vesiculosa]